MQGLDRRPSLYAYTAREFCYIIFAYWLLGSLPMNVCADVFRAYIALAAKLLKIFQIERFLPVRKVKKTIFASFPHQIITFTFSFPFFESISANVYLSSDT